jgi:hypothetical protein
MVSMSIPSSYENLALHGKEIYIDWGNEMLPAQKNIFSAGLDDNSHYPMSF